MIESKKVDLSWITQSESAPTTEVEMAGMTYQVPLSSEMDLITSLKDFNGALRTWPKKKLESRWEIFESIRESFRADRDHIARIMKAERGEKLGLREHKELFDVLEHWRLEDLKSPGGEPASPWPVRGFA